MSENIKLALCSAFTCVVTSIIAIFLAFVTAEVFDIFEYMMPMVVIYYFVAIAGIVFVALGMLDNV
jgi:hypothetical protein